MSSPESTAPFDRYAERYDAWYDTDRGRALQATEVACLQPLLEWLPRPYLKVSMGTGRLPGRWASNEA